MRKCLLLPHWNPQASNLQSTLGDKDLVLALSLSALAQGRRHFRGVASVEDFVPYDRIMALALRAHEINLEFSREAFQGQTLDGYDWAKICWHMQQWFFRDVLLAEELVSALNARGYEKIIWLGKVEKHKALYLPTYASVAGVFRFHLPGKFETRDWPEKPGFKSLDPWKRTIQAGLGILYKRTIFQEPSPRPCQVVALWSINEWDRYTDALTDLSGEFGDQFQLWILGARSPNRLKQWARSRKVTLLNVPYPERIDPEIIEFFDQTWKHWQTQGAEDFAQSTDCPVLAAGELQGRFHFLFEKIWPRMAQWAKDLERQLRRANPRWLIGSSNYPPEWALPHYLAAKLGISSVALPHSYVQYGDGWVGSSFLACRNRFERIHFQNSFPDDNRVLYCHNAGNELSYHARGNHYPRDPQSRIVALLTADPDYSGSIMPTANRSVFWKSWEEIYSFPPDLADLRICIKSHPRGDLLPLLQNSPPAIHPQITLIPSSASVIELIGEAWVVVLANHYGGVAAHAIASEKPVIFLNSAQPFWPRTETHAHLAGEVIQSVPALWDLLRELKRSPLRYGELAERCRNYKEEYLKEEKTSLGQQIAILNDQGIPSIANRSGSKPLELAI